MTEETVEVPIVNIDVAQELLKPRVVALLFFDFASFTRNEKVNLLGIFDRVRVNRDTKRTHPIGIFVRTGQTFNSQIQLVIHGPDGTRLAGFGFESTLPENSERRPFQTQGLYRLELETPLEGLYWFNVSYKGESIGGAGLLVEFKDVEDNKDEYTSGDA